MGALILGDVHLGKSGQLGKVGLGAALNSRVVDQITILDWVLERALENNAVIIITGDIFEEPRPSPQLITILIDWLKRCETNNINVHIIMGNHDMLRTGNYYTSALDIISSCEIENVFVYKDINTIYIDNTAFTLVPFRDRKSFNVSSNIEALELLRNQFAYEHASIPLMYSKVMIGHIAIEGSIHVGDEIDDLSNELMCSLNMFAGYDYVWMGHIHMPQVLSKKPHISHIGSMDLSNFGETDHKKHIVIFDAASGKDFRTEAIPTRPLKKIVLLVPKDTKDTTKYILNELNQPKYNIEKAIVRLEVHLASPDIISMNREAVEKGLYTMGAHHIAGISESKKLSPIKKDDNNIDTTVDVNAAIKMYAASQIEEDKRDAFIKLAVDIYAKYQHEGKLL